MCVHNAKRDSFVFASLDLVTPRGVERWDPLRPPRGDSSGRTVAVFPLKWMRGRARVLATYVNAQGHVDFRALARAPTDLETYVTWLATTDAAAWPDPRARLAHYVNSYNALSMFGVIAGG